LNTDAEKKVLDQMERELHKPRPHDVPETPLFHYTDSNGLLGILRSKQVWATHHAHVNDTQEITVGERTVDAVAESILAKTAVDTPARWLLENFVKLHKSDGQSLTKITGVYIASFSDRGNQLSQWRGYAAGGAGYSIGLREFRLPRADRVDAELALILMKCEYDRDEFTRKVERVLTEVVDGFDAYVRAFGVNVDVFNALMFQAVSIALRRVALLIPALKNSQFEEEREWRLVAIPMPKHQHRIVQYRSGPNGIVPYIPIDLAEDGEPLKLEKIYVGPRQEPSIGVETASAFLASQGYDRLDLVEHSRIPYRA
jgi:hypothetical protein